MVLKPGIGSVCWLLAQSQANANRSVAGRARFRVVVAIEQERRIICAPGGGRNRMITLDALRMLDMDDW
jgi:hypothetical protein